MYLSESYKRRLKELSRRHKELKNIFDKYDFNDNNLNEIRKIIRSLL